MPEKPQILHTELVAESTLFHIEAVDLRFSNGQERRFERMRGSRGAGTVLIIPMDGPDTLLLVREYAVGSEQYELGFPKGVIERNESPIEGANREMKEEIGKGARDLQLLKPLRNAPGYSCAQMHVVLARDLYDDPLEGDEPEPIEVVPWSLRDLPALFARDDFSEARSIAALYLCQQFLNNEE